MQLTQEVNPLIKSSNVQDKKFSIQASSKAFTILSSSLYSDKYTAIVRELSTNASDAQVAAGRGDVPIKVMLPNYIDNNFSVEDCGTGIDPEEFEKIYTTYFYSTKTQTNDQVGCFGLGSKSPFAYTDQFTVENRWNGVSYFYSCFKNELGEPSVALLGKTPTDKTGLKVQFHVKSGDMNSFVYAAQKILQWFTVPPETNIHVENLGCDDPVYIPASGETSWGTLRIRMGQVVYPVMLRDISSDFHHYPIEQYVVNVPIGSVDVTPSRESLELNNRTRGAIIDAANKIKEYLKEQKELVLNSDLTKFGKFKKLLSFLPFVLLKDEYPNGTVFAEVYSSIFNIKGYARYNKSSWRKSLEKITYNNAIDNKSIIIINDVKRGVVKRVEKLASDNSAKHFHVFHQDNKPELYKLGFEESDFIYLSDIEIPKNSTFSGGSSGKKTNCCLLKKSGWKIKKIGTFLPKDQNEGIYVNESEIVDLNYNSIQELLNTEDIHVFTDSQYKLLRISNRNFKHLSQVSEEFLNGKDYVKAVVANRTSNDRTHLYMRRLSNNIESKDINEYVEKYSRTSDISLEELALAEVHFEVVRQFNYDLYSEFQEKSAALEDERKTDLEKIFKKYPLLNFVLDKAIDSDIMNSVTDYVKMIDNKESK